MRIALSSLCSAGLTVEDFDFTVKLHSCECVKTAEELTAESFHSSQRILLSLKTFPATYMSD